MSRVRVSDHAILQWLEKVEGVDVDAIERRIANAVRTGVAHGAAGVRVEGVTFKVQYNPGEAVVTTTYSPRLREHLAEPRREVAELQRLRDADAPFLNYHPDEMEPVLMDVPVD